MKNEALSNDFVLDGDGGSAARVGPAGLGRLAAVSPCSA
jgi:hypothetical protein